MGTGHGFALYGGGQLAPLHNRELVERLAAKEVLARKHQSHLGRLGQKAKLFH